jgi:thymidylate kinase
MIVLFEGPRVAGKTTIISKVSSILEAWDLPVQRWKDERGKDPVADMNLILDEGIFTDDTIWLLDRFHFSEWVISKAIRKAQFEGSKWTFYEASLQQIDERLREKNAFIVFVVGSPWILDARRQKTNQKDPIGESTKSLFWWNNNMSKTMCDSIRVINDRQGGLDSLARMLSDFIFIRWQRFGPKPGAVEEAEKEGGIIEKIEVLEENLEPKGGPIALPDDAAEEIIEELDDGIPF